MRRIWLSTILIAACFTPIATEGQQIPRQAISDSAFRSLILMRLQAYGRGDSAAYHRLIADDFVHIMDSGVRRTEKQLLTVVASNVGSKTTFKIGALHKKIYGQLAVVDCDWVGFDPFGPREVAQPMRETDVFIWRGRRWLFLNHEETLVVVRPEPAQPNAALLDDYVGRYQWWPGYVDIITRKGNTLYGQDSLNVTPTAFEPASDESFLIPGQASLVVFVRNRNGVVTHYVAHSPNGSVVVARKLGLPASEKQ